VSAGPRSLESRKKVRVTLTVHSDRLAWTCDAADHRDVLLVHEVIDIATRHGSERSMLHTARVACTALRAQGIEVEVHEMV
jgi:hypothetical protein